MKLERDSFEASNDFANFGQEILQPAAVAEPTPAAPATPPESAPAPAEGEEAAPAAVAEPKVEESEPKAEAQPAAKPQAAAIELEAGGSKHSFTLDPADPKLKETLLRGLGQPKFQAERDEAIKGRKAAEEQMKASKEKAEVWDSLEQLRGLGHDDLVAQAVLGKEGMERLKAQLAREYITETEGSDEDRAALNKQRADKHKSVQDYFRDQETKAREEGLSKREDQIEESRLRGLGTVAMKRHDFGKMIDDKDIASSYNDDLWALAWSDLQRLAETQEIGPADIDNAFAARAKRLSAGIAKRVEAKMTEKVEAAQTAARRQAAVVATARYPGAQSAVKSSAQVADEWDGRSSRELLRSLLGR